MILEQTIEALPLAALVVDAQDRIRLANGKAVGLFGARAVGSPLRTVLRQPAVLGAVEQVRGERGPALTRVLLQDGPRDIILMLHGATLPDGMILLTFEDLTEREAAAQIRRDFVANVSHELRTPLTALLGFIETLQGPARDDPAARARFLGIMGTEAARMNRLVQDLLSLSQVESQERMRPADRVDLSALVNGAVRSVAPLAEQARVALVVKGTDQPLVLAADADQLRQVLTNLIENAIKYGGSGQKVEISLQRLDRDPELRGPGVMLAVRDHGPGIDAVHIPRLTERFYRIDSHRSRAMGGTGLGLAIVKHIVNRHRGRLRIDSTLGQGATFAVHLPM